MASQLTHVRTVEKLRAAAALIEDEQFEAAEVMVRTALRDLEVRRIANPDVIPRQQKVRALPLSKKEQAQRRRQNARIGGY